VGPCAATGARSAGVGGQRNIENEFQFHNYPLGETNQPALYP
jgi:hypothetical protein